MENTKEWLQQSAWIYPKDEAAFLPLLEGIMREHFGGSFRMWQNKDHINSGNYPQYLCSADLRGLGGDVVHLWRDGQTWWPASGDYSLEDEENAELLLRKAILQYWERR